MTTLSKCLPYRGDSLYGLHCIRDIQLILCDMRSHFLQYVIFKSLHIHIMMRPNIEVMCMIKNHATSVWLTLLYDHCQCLVSLLFPDMVFIIATLAIPTSNIFKCLYFNYLFPLQAQKCK